MTEGSSSKAPDRESATIAIMSTTPPRISELMLQPNLKLVGISNLKTWQYMIEILLNQHGLQDYLSISKNTKVDASNALVKMCICNNIATEFIPIMAGEEFCAQGYKSLCRFIQGNSMAAVKSNLRTFIKLADNFHTFSTAAEYILAHKACIDQFASLGVEWRSIVYGLHFLQAVASKYPSWAANQDYLFSVSTTTAPPPSCATLYMTLQDHIRLEEQQALNASPPNQAHATGNDQKDKKKDKKDGKKDKKEKKKCNQCNGPHASDACFFEHPELIEGYVKKFDREWKPDPVQKAEYEKHKKSSTGADNAHMAGYDSRLDRYNPFNSGSSHHVQLTWTERAIPNECCCHTDHSSDQCWDLSQEVYRLSSSDSLE